MKKTTSQLMCYSKRRLFLFLTGSLFNTGRTNKMSILADECKLLTSNNEIASAAAQNKPELKYEDAKCR